ncbi:basic proline-rich protein-like [Monodon monoceros]|uniref:basic proline-rich protein-like n=1 Tax=Monodon monoceros TaxID=40151 RepID=UPI0010F7D9D9|nr:basic proline-rich protein-like [Monodon monoceros]
MTENSRSVTKKKHLGLPQRVSTTEHRFLVPNSTNNPKHGTKQSCEIHTHKPHTGNRPRQPRKNRPGEKTPGGPLSSEDNNTPGREVAGHGGVAPKTSPQPPHFPGNANPSAAVTGRVAGLGAWSRVGAAEGGSPRRPGAQESPRPARPRRGKPMGDRSLPRPLPPPPRLTAGVSGSQPRAGAAVRRRRRRRDPGPRRRVIIPPARAGPGPGPRPPEPSPRPSHGGSPLSLPPAPPPGLSPPPPPLHRALPPQPPAAVRGHRRAPGSAAAVVARLDELSAERPPPSGRPLLAGTSPQPRAMTPTEAEVSESWRVRMTS